MAHGYVAPPSNVTGPTGATMLDFEVLEEAIACVVSFCVIRSFDVFTTREQRVGQTKRISSWITPSWFY